VRYISNKYKPELNGKTPADKGRVDMLANIVDEVWMESAKQCYYSDNRKEVAALALESMKPLVAYLGEKQYLIGD
jgi:hypothetical protein